MGCDADAAVTVQSAPAKFDSWRVFAKQKNTETKIPKSIRTHQQKSREKVKQMGEKSATKKTD